MIRSAQNLCCRDARAIPFGRLRRAILESLLAGLLAVVALSATAADAVRGKALYGTTPGGTSCGNSNCHRADPSGNANRILKGANSPATIQNAINNDTGGMGIYQNNVLTATDVADIAAYLANPNGAAGPAATISPTTLSFGSIAVGGSSGNQTITLGNAGSAALSITAITVSGSSFAVAGGTCAAGGSVAAAGSCTMLVVFRPQAAGALSGSLGVTHNATGSPSTVSLSGTGTTAAATITTTPAALSFAAQNVGTSSASQTVTVSNTGSAPLNFTALTITGANAADFSRGGTCAVGTAVVAGAGCTAIITFSPQAAGGRSAALTLNSDAGNGVVNVALSGTGNAAAQAAVNPASLNFGSVAVGVQGTAQSVTVSNSGSAALTLGAIGVTNPQFAITGGTCASGGSVAAGSGSCTVQVNFAPTTGGTASTTLSIAHNAPNSPLMVALSGTGTVPAAPVAQLSPTTLNFSQVVGSPSLPQIAMLANTGTAPLSIVSIGLGGAAAVDYSIGAGSTCAAGGSVAAGSACSISLVFTPGTIGARNAMLSIVHGDTVRSPSTVALNGTGTSVPTGLLSVNQISLSFAAQSLGTTSAAQTVSVSNGGSAPLTLSSLAVGGANAGDFSLPAGTNTCTATTTLAVGTSCPVNVVFAPTAASGLRSASLAISAGSAGSASITLAGAAAPAAAPIVGLNPASLDLGPATTGQTAASKTVTLTNSGSAGLLISSLTASPAAFVMSHDCPSSLTAGAFCTLTVSFTPSVVGAASGTVALVSNAATSPNALALSGTGIAPAPATLAWLSAAAVTFADTAVGSQSAPQSIVLLNSGGSAALLQGFQFAGLASGEFRVDPSSTCVVGSGIAAGGNCMMNIVFAPASAGPRSGGMSVASNATPPPALNLIGNGISSGVPMLGLSPIAMTLTGQPNQPLQPQALVISSDGAAPLQVTAVQAGKDLALLDSGSTGGGNCRPAPFTLAPGASCTMVVNPLARSVSSTITVSSNASAQPAQVGVSGSSLTNVGAGGSAAGLLALAAIAWRRRRRSARGD